MAKTAEYGLGPHTFPRGWFMIAAADEVVDKPVPLRFFGREFVAYRGESGKVYLVDAYCPHMRIHIGIHATFGHTCANTRCRRYPPNISSPPSPVSATPTCWRASRATIAIGTCELSAKGSS